MNKKILISIVVVAFILALPISSVIGTNNDIQYNTKTVQSPLFEHRLKPQHTVQSTYLRKGNMLSLFAEEKISYEQTIDRAITHLQRNPTLYTRILNQIKTHQSIPILLEENNIGINEFEAYSTALLHNPVLLEQEMNKVKQYLPDTPIPLGINTTNPIAMLILIIVMIPLIITIGILIATITIVTCLNINNCFENLVQRMIDNIFQGLTQP